MQTLTAASLAQYTEPTLLLPRLAGDHHESIIIELARQLVMAGRIDDGPGFVNLVLTHDELAPSVFDGVAFPLGHGRMVKKLSFTIGLAPRSFRWGHPNAPLVHTVVLIAAPLSDESGYLSIVPAFCKLLNDQAAVSRLRQSTDPGEMLEVLQRLRF